MASRKHKAPPAASDDDDAATAPISSREAQCRAGVLRQLRPDAHDHQVAASKAASAKRSAGAMSKEERQAKRAKHMKEVRERQRAARTVAAAEAAVAEPSAAVAESSAANPSAADPLPQRRLAPERHPRLDRGQPGQLHGGAVLWAGHHRDQGERGDDRPRGSHMQELGTPGTGGGGAPYPLCSQAQRSSACVDRWRSG